MLSRPIVIEIIEDELVASLRRKTPAQRLSISFDMWSFARDQLNFLLRSQHPDWDEKQLKAEFRRRMLGST
jgi:hypothetical protein